MWLSPLFKWASIAKLSLDLLIIMPHIQTEKKSATIFPVDCIIVVDWTFSGQLLLVKNIKRNYCKDDHFLITFEL